MPNRDLAAKKYIPGMTNTAASAPVDRSHSLTALIALGKGGHGENINCT